MRTIRPKKPPWITRNIDHAFRRYKKKYKNFKTRGFPASMNTSIQEAKSDYNKLVSDAKEKYLKSEGSKLSNPDTDSKSYWKVIKGFIKSSKFPAIPPLLHRGIYVSDFQEKSNIFNEFFADQCTVLDTGSVLPDFSFVTNLRLSNVTLSKDLIAKIISNLNVKKASGNDEVSARMIKICGNTLIEPLFTIFDNCLKKGVFPNIWKKANVVPIYKKGKRDLVKNYRPVSLLPILGKIFEKIIFDSLYSYLIENNMITSKQSGFIKGDSTINQLLSISQKINEAFDCDIPSEVFAVFLDISKAFDKVWHPGLLFKLKKNWNPRRNA